MPPCRRQVEIDMQLDGLPVRYIAAFWATTAAKLTPGILARGYTQTDRENS